jgi:hypothetical protein
MGGRIARLPHLRATYLCINSLTGKSGTPSVKKDRTVNDKFNIDMGSISITLSHKRIQSWGSMKTFTVYRVDYRTNKKILIGRLVERRREERINNAADMLRLAKKTYATSSIDTNIFIVNEGSGEILFGGT